MKRGRVSLPPPTAAMISGFHALGMYDEGSDYEHGPLPRRKNKAWSRSFWNAGPGRVHHVPAVPDPDECARADKKITNGRKG